MPKDIAALIPSTTIASSSLTGSYQAINPLGLPFACYELRIINASNMNVSISTDGTNEYEYVLLGQTRELHAQNNSGPGNWKGYWPVGMVFYASGTAGTGSIKLCGSYQPN
jgi:hypothetical protein